MTNQLIRFVLVGSLATALHTVVVWLCEALMPSLHLNVSNVIGFLCAFPVSYWGQRSFTFGHDGRHRPALIRFGASQLFGLIINSAVVFLMVDFLSASIRYLCWLASDPLLLPFLS